MRKPVFDQGVFDNLVHYVIASCPDTGKLGSTKLQKILWKVDTGWYKLHAKPITGASYVKRQYGPATDELWRGRERLVQRGLIRYWRDRAFTESHPKDVYVSQVHPITSVLTAEQRRLVDFWVREICDKHTAASISEDTHGYAWSIAEMGEEMPMASVFVEDIPEEADSESIEWATAEAKRLRLGET